MRFLFFCLALGLASTQLAAANTLPLPTQTGEELSALVLDISDINFENAELATVCCTATASGSDNSVRVCRGDGDGDKACAHISNRT